MKRLKFLFAVLSFLIASNARSQNNTSSDFSVAGVFVASTPCSEKTKPVPGIPENAECELIKWNLTLYQNLSDKTPATFKLACVYGMPKQGTRGFIDGGKNVELEGTWTVIAGTQTNSRAIVYQLTDNKTNKSISFLKLNDDLLHLLDSDGRLMIGSAAWSYTLNRINNK